MSHRPTYVYRVVVDRWPTGDGAPWPRFIAGPGGGYGRTSWDDPEVAWFWKLADPDTSSIQDVIDEEFAADHDTAGEITGWILPDPTRRHWLSAAAARRWIRRAGLLGAEAHLESGRIRWLEAVE